MSAICSKRTRPNKPSVNLEETDDVKCETCNSGHRAAELLLCDACDSGYHLFCLRPILPRVPKGYWFCPSCSILKNPNKKSPREIKAIDKPNQIQLVQTKIDDFFKIRRYNDDNSWIKKKKKRNVGLRLTPKRRSKLLAFIPSEDTERRIEQMRSLADALMSSAAQFSNDLTYFSGMAPRSANCAYLEREGMQIMSKDDAETLNSCKKMMERGECPPLMVVYDIVEGYTVQADRFIKDLTIITEYVGDVDYLSNRENDDGDSMMTLLTAKDPSKSLVICPDKRSNIARFINGINNHTPEGKRKQNVKCVRFSVNGEARVLLIAIRDIKMGERLYYDYNGYEHEYPTEHFV